MQRRTIRAVAFDKDGVLADSEPINLRSAFKIFADHHFPLDAAAATEIVGKHPADYLPLLAGRFGIGADEQAQMLEEKGRLYRAWWDEHGVLFDGARETLSATRLSGVQTAIATSSTGAELDAFLQKFDLAAFFDVTLSRDDVSRTKPDPEIYRVAAQRLGVPPHQLLVVEDSEFGIQSARAAGVFCVAVQSTHVVPERAVGADAHIASIVELPRLLAELAEP